jgi:hypothetical protein
MGQVKQARSIKELQYIYSECIFQWEILNIQNFQQCRLLCEQNSLTNAYKGVQFKKELLFLTYSIYFCDLCPELRIAFSFLTPTSKRPKADKTSEQSQLKYTTKKGEIKYLALSKSPPSINLIS